MYNIQAAPTVPPAGGGNGGANGATIAAAIVAGVTGASQLERDKKERYQDHEKLQIMAACGLNPTEWDQVPQITQDGRTASAV